MGGFAFLRPKSTNSVPVIRPEGIVVTTSMSIWHKDTEAAPTFHVRSTDAEDIRRKLMGDLDRCMIAHLADTLEDDEGAQQYLANRNDPGLYEFYSRLRDLR